MDKEKAKKALTNHRNDIDRVSTDVWMDALADLLYVYLGKDSKLYQKAANRSIYSKFEKTDKYELINQAILLLDDLPPHLPYPNITPPRKIPSEEKNWINSQQKSKDAPTKKWQKIGVIVSIILFLLTLLLNNFLRK